MNLTCKAPILTHGPYFTALALALSLSGCYDDYEAPADQTGGASSAGSDAGGSSNGGANTSGGKQSEPDPAEGNVGGSGGVSPGDVSASGGRSAEGGQTDSGGNSDMGGAPDTGETGGSPPVGGASTGGSSPNGGTASGGTEQGGSGGGTQVAESICFDDSGAPLPYDYSFGLASEYAFELSMSCTVGGYILPLVLSDPEQLSAVNAFVLDATDWYRAEILGCQGETNALGPDAYGLLPASESSALSDADVDASMAVFLSVMDRHDDQPDATSKDKKDKITKRIKLVKTRAVRNDTGELTKTLSEPDCIPVEG